MASQENSQKIYKVLAEFGSPLKEITGRTFVAKDIIFQIGLPPRRIDLITGIDGVDFIDAYRNRKVVAIEGLKVPFLSLEDIVRNKRVTGREKDLLDVKQLKNRAKK